MTKPRIVLAAQAGWCDELKVQLATAYSVVQQSERDGYTKALIDPPAALIIVDGDCEAWDWWTTIPKSSPATRRIPIWLVSSMPSVRAAGPVKGADLCLDPEQLMQDLPQRVAAHARLTDPARQEQLGCECQEPLPELAVQGVKKFNAGEYYAQHDLFEEQWVNTTGPVRDLYRAILQIGVAYYQIERGNYRGAFKMLQRSVQWLAVLPDVCQGVDVARLRADALAVRTELEQLGEAGFARFNRQLLQPLRLLEPLD